MNNYPSGNTQQIKELLLMYEKLKNGETKVYLEEQSFELLCEYFEEQENYYKALEIIKLGVYTYPYSADLLVKQADILMYFHQILQAEKLLENAYILDSCNIDYYILKIEIFVRKKEIEKAEQLLAEAKTKFDKEDIVEILEAVIDIFDEYFYHNKITDYLIEILTIDPKNDFALKEISFWPQINNKLEETIEFHQQLINIDPYNYLVWFNLGIFYYSIGLHEKSIEAYEYCLAIDEHFEYGLKNLAIGLLTTKKYTKAITVLEDLLSQLEVPDGIIYSMLALSYYKKREYHKSTHYYKTALSLINNDENVYTLLCYSLYREKKYTAVIEHIKKAIISKNKQPFYNELLGDCYFELNQFKNAISFYFNCLVIKKNNQKVWIKYLKCFIHLNQYTNGIEKSEMAFAILKKPIFIFFKMGFYALNNEIDKAKEMYQKYKEYNIKLPSKYFKYFPILKEQYFLLDKKNN